MRPSRRERHGTHRYRKQRLSGISENPPKRISDPLLYRGFRFKRGDQAGWKSIRGELLPVSRTPGQSGFPISLNIHSEKSSISGALPINTLGAVSERPCTRAAMCANAGWVCLTRGACLKATMGAVNKHGRRANSGDPEASRWRSITPEPA